MFETELFTLVYHELLQSGDKPPKRVIIGHQSNIMNDIIYSNLKRMLRMDKQAIIFAHKRAETYTTALELIDIVKERSGDA